MKTEDAFDYSNECILCFECIIVCVPNALSTSVGLDFGNRELLTTNAPVNLSK